MSPWAITYPFPEHPVWPLGPCSTLGSHGLLATLAMYPTPYVIVGLDPQLAEVMESDLERCRVRLGHDAGLRCSPTVPKLAALAVCTTDDADLAYRTRMDRERGWHPGIAASGLLALAFAVATPHTLPWLLLGGVPSVVRVATNAGVKRIGFGVEPGVGAGVRLCLGTVTLEPAGEAS